MKSIDKPRRYLNPEEALSARTEQQGECLVWTGAITHLGYGSMTINNRAVPVHRFAWERVKGPIPNGLVIDHICHNRACVNVEHLRAVSQMQNMWNRKGAERGKKHTKIRNVYRYPNGWIVRIQKQGKIHNFGTYRTEEEAASVAERARQKLFGDFKGRAS